MFFRLTEVVKNLLIINGLFYLAIITMPEFMYNNFALYYPWSPKFMPHQLVTHMFMHSIDFYHILGNMFALFMFGPLLENKMGAKRFLTFYMITGLGAAALHLGAAYFESYSIVSNFSAADIEYVLSKEFMEKWQTDGVMDANLANLYSAVATPTVGASGAVFGVLMGFGMLFPEFRVMLLFPPIPLKARQLVLLYGIGEVFLMIRNNPGDNVAHFAHIGGMLFAYLLIRIWRQKRLI